MTDITSSITSSDILSTATARLLDTVDGLRDGDWPGASGCAGWSRAHVIAHLTLNAEALAGVLRGLADGRATVMYASGTARDADIETLAARPADVIRDRLRASAEDFTEALTGLPRVAPDATFDRTPGGQQMLAHTVPLLRLREVEIHHADLRAGYGHVDWPGETAVLFLEHDAGRYDGPPLRAYATDLDRTFALGPAGDSADSTVQVSGPASALAWWLSGRDPGDQLTSATGEVPGMEGR